MGRFCFAKSRFFRLVQVTCAAVALHLSATSVMADPPCPREADGMVVFPDTSIAMKTGLEVNPDGASASYVPGDHGFTYISNGVNLIERGQKVSCSAAGNGGKCRREWAEAEAGNFGAGTPEFCVFAMEVEPLTAGGQKVACELPKKGRFTVGNGKGRPVSGDPIPTVAGGEIKPYVSTTTLTHTKNGKTIYFDSALLPGLVAPTTRPDLVGAIAWVKYGEHEVFAIVNDTGPRFGEASVALHQAVRTGQIGPAQAVGPIPVDQRCSEVETGLKPPFTSRPDAGRDDRCRSGYKATTAADIRAYSGIEGGVTTIILPAVRPPMRDHTATVELTPALFGKLASDAGYTSQKLETMAACVNR